MKTPYKNIYSVLKANRYLSIGAILMAFITNLVFGLVALSSYKKSLNSAFAIGSDGQVIPLKLVTQKENFKIEALAHLELFFYNFYNIDASSYQKNLEKALWLGDSSIDNLYRQKKAEGLYNRLLQYSLLQRVLNIDSDITEDKTSYSFKSIIEFEVNRGTVTDTYQMTCSGQFITVARNFPHNPHGLLITNYYENSLKKLENEN